MESVRVSLLPLNHEKTEKKREYQKKYREAHRKRNTTFIIQPNPPPVKFE